MGETVRLPAGRTSETIQGVQLQEVFQHGTIGVDSGFIRCVYNAKNQSGSTVTLLCEKMEGCCVTGCCPKDQFWIFPLVCFLIFVLVVFCVGTVSIIVCFQRTKNRQRRTEKEIYSQSRASELGANHQTQQQNNYGTGRFPRTIPNNPPQQHDQYQETVHYQQRHLPARNHYQTQYSTSHRF
uniref:CX domain-containing protein n=1 Tax=Meloidogyne hapla TaxID=6305 RepID=A0A1I8BIW9_MELHA